MDIKTAAIAALLSGVSAAAATGLPPAVAGRIDGLVERAMERGGIPGLSIAVARGDEVVLERGYGLADLENEVPATAQTRYRTASIAKPMAAAVALKLAETGRLDLDAPVQTYLPEFPEKRWPLTSRHLLSHLGGVRHYRRPGEAVGKDHYPSVRGALELFAADPLLHQPGSKFKYTTYGYNLLGAVAEVAGGADFATLLARFVTGPAGMAHTGIDSQRDIIPGRSRGYALRRGQLVNAELHDTSMKIPGGGLLGTAGDLPRFAAALNSGAILRDETRAQMWTRARLNDGAQIQYGMGWLVSPDGAPTKRVSHSGGQAGTSTLLVLHPEEGTAVAVMCNLEGAELAPLVSAVFAALGDSD